MAEELEELGFEVKVEGQSKFSEEMKLIGKSVSSITAEMKEYKETIKTLQSQINVATDKISDYNRQISEAHTLEQRSGLAEQRIAQEKQLEGLKNNLKNARSFYKELQAQKKFVSGLSLQRTSVVPGAYGNKTLQTFQSKKRPRVSELLRGRSLYTVQAENEQITKVTKEQEKINKKAKNSRIKRILQYKIIAGLFRRIVKTATEGFSLLQNNQELTNSLATIRATTLSISTAIASVLTPTLQALSNIMQPLGDQMILLANQMSKANAEAAGQSQYYKLSASAIRDYAQSLQEANSQLTQLDKFATLSKGSPLLGAYADINEAFTKDPFENFTEGAEKAGEQAEKTQLQFSGIVNVIKIVVGVLESFTETINNMGLDIGDVIYGVGLAFLALKNKAGAAISSLIAIMQLASPEASAWAKIISGAVLTAAAAYVGFGIAKAFAINPVYGLAIGAASGALTAAIAAAVGGVRSLAGSSAGTGSVSTPTASTYGYDRMAMSGYYPSAGEDFASQLGDSVATGVSNGLSGRGGVQNVTVPVYIGGNKLAEVTQKIDYYNTKNSATGTRF